MHICFSIKIEATGSQFMNHAHGTGTSNSIDKIVYLLVRVLLGIVTREGYRDTLIVAPP
jgi:hypothetical protein